jgi:hypothetical protein
VDGWSRDGTCAVVTPVGTDDPLRLRPLTTADAAALHRIHGDDETARFLSFPAKSRSEVDDALRVVETDHATRPRTVHHYAVELDGDVVGVGRLGRGGPARSSGPRPRDPRVRPAPRPDRAGSGASPRRRPGGTGRGDRGRRRPVGGGRPRRPRVGEGAAGPGFRARRDDRPPVPARRPASLRRPRHPAPEQLRGLGTEDRPQPLLREPPVQGLDRPVPGRRGGSRQHAGAGPGA